MKKLLIILFLLSISCLTFAKTIRVGVAMGMPPMAYMSKGEIVGVEIDLLKEFAKQNELRYELVNLKFEDLIPALEDNKIDVIMATMSYTPARAKRVDFSETYAKVGQMPLIHKKNTSKYQNATMLFNTVENICVVKDYTAQEFAKEKFHYAKFNVVDEPTKAVERLIKDESQIFIADSILVLWLAQTYKDEGLLHIPVILNKENIAWAVKKGNNELLAQLNNFINKLKTENKLDAIIRERIPYYDSKIYK